MGHYALIVTLLLFSFPLKSVDECQDFKTDVMICLNEGPDSAYARYGREYKGKLPRTDMFTVCRLKKSEWFIDEKGKKKTCLTSVHTNIRKIYPIL